MTRRTYFIGQRKQNGNENKSMGFLGVVLCRSEALHVAGGGYVVDEKHGAASQLIRKGDVGIQVGEAQGSVLVHHFTEGSGLLIGGVCLSQQRLGSGKALRVGHPVALGMLVELAVNGEQVPELVDGVHG